MEIAPFPASRIIHFFTLYRNLLHKSFVIQAVAVVVMRLLTLRSAQPSQIHSRPRLVGRTANHKIKIKCGCTPTPAMGYAVDFDLNVGESAHLAEEALDNGRHSDLGPVDENYAFPTQSNQFGCVYNGIL